MGIRMIVEVLDNAPDELTARERLLLVAVAEKANDDTRTCWPGFDTLTRRTGLSPSSVRAILAQLADKGYEIRVPLRTDKNGKQVFAHHRHRTEYRLPRFPPRRQNPGTIKAPESQHLDDGKAPGSGTGRRQDPSGKAPGSRRPFPHEPSEEPSNQRARADDEMAAVVEALPDRTEKTIHDEHHTGSRNGKPGREWLAGTVDFVTERLTAVIPTRTYDRRDITDSITGFLQGKTVTNPGAFIRKCATDNPLQFAPTPGPARYQPEEKP